MKPAETAVTEWRAANVGHTQVNSSASVKRAITGKVCSTNVQVSLQFVCNSVRYLLLCKKTTPKLNDLKQEVLTACESAGQLFGSQSCQRLHLSSAMG